MIDKFAHENQPGETAKHFPSEPGGIILNRFGLLILLAGILLAAWAHLTPIVILLGFVFAAVGLSKLWSRFSLNNVFCERSLSEQRVFPGESVELKLRLVNRKLLPLPWIQMDDEVPNKLIPDSRSLEAGKNPGTSLISKTAALLWYTGASWKHQLYCAKRGYYPIGPISLTSGDIFGFYPRSDSKPLIDHIIVYPKIYSVNHLGIPSLYPVGDTRAERRIFEDPTRTIGIRDYTPHDSLRRIHWKATARHQNLQVKVFEPTTTLNVALFLATESFQYYGTFNEDDFELGISIAASIASYITEQGSPVGLFVNTRQADSSQPAVISPGSSGGQLVAILEALAKTTPSVSGPFETFLQNEGKGLPWGTTFVFIVSRPSEPLIRLLNGFKESRRRLLVMQAGAQKIEGADYGITWHHILHPEDLIKISEGPV